MRFTILSHAGLAVEHEGVQVIFDPWLVGSCYWRSWWNFPEPPSEVVERLAPRYIYLTHLHWDHFHGPSLQKFDPSTTIIVPKVPTRRMVQDLEWLGFRNVIEVAHGQQLRLGNDFYLRSYQFGVTVDSGVVISGGGYHLFNCNDAKFFGLPLKQITDTYPKIDFIFRSHSSASPIPYCIEDYQRLLPNDPAEYDSADQFIGCALFVGARCAIPFASNHCFLHRDTIYFNGTATTPEDVRRRYEVAAARLHSDSKCVVMPPGSTWTDTEGFSVVPFDFGARKQYIEAMQEKYRDKLDRTYQEEETTVADFSAFQTYFDGFVKAVPLPVRKNFHARALAIRARRWREPLEVMRIMFRRFVLGQRFSVKDVYGRKAEPQPLR